MRKELSSLSSKFDIYKEGSGRGSMACNPPPLNSRIKMHKHRDLKAVFVASLAPNTSCEYIKSYLAAKVSSANLGRASILKMSTTQPRAISSFKIIVPTTNVESVFNTPL